MNIFIKFKSPPVIIFGLEVTALREKTPLNSGDIFALTNELS
jgi:hypothetical protein